MFKGLYSVIYPTSNLDADKAWWTKLLGIAPYFDQPFYAGFQVEGYELGLDPNAGAEGNTQAVGADARIGISLFGQRDNHY